MEPEFMVFTKEEEDMLCGILDSLSGQMTELYEKLYVCACNVMKQHVPAQVADEVEKIVFQTLLFRSLGLFSGFAVDSGELSVPEEDGPIAFYIRENTTEAMKACGFDIAAMKSAEK